MNLYCVVTTVNAPTRTAKVLAEHCPDRVIIVGDLNTPGDWASPGTEFYSLERQGQLGFAINSHLKIAHYARKNIGYLQAMRAGAECIYDTDDDNVPSSAWRPRELDCDAYAVTQRGWCNVYRYFHYSDIWPRGFGLSKLTDSPPAVGESSNVACPVQQGLADGEPDVDAIWRLAAMPSWMRGRRVLFRDHKSIALGTGAWCPFNSQTTWWFKEAYPLLYLPSHATFRMTDIWRSFVAQRCLWEIGRGVVFHSPSEVLQERNEHDLLKDFAEEVPGYLLNEKITTVLEELHLSHEPSAVVSNLVGCYEALVEHGFLPPEELDCVRAWSDDVEKAQEVIQ